MDDPEGDARIVAEVERRLAVARREMERDYDERRREARLQEHRLREHLRKDREEWEAYRREQGKVLSDRAETLRRREESARKQADLKEKARADLVAAKAQVDEGKEAQEAARRELAARVEALQGRVARLRKAMRAGGAVGILVAAGLALSAWRVPWPGPWAYVMAVVAGLGGAFLLVQGRKP